MGDFNMPPGVSVNDIPGNRPEDMREEAFWETLDEKMREKYPRGYNELMSIFADHDGFDEVVYAYVNIARDLVSADAYAEGQQEAEMYHFEIEQAIYEQELMTQEELTKFGNAVREVKKRWKNSDA